MMPGRCRGNASLGLAMLDLLAISSLIAAAIACTTGMVWCYRGANKILVLRACDFFDSRSPAGDRSAMANFSVVLSVAKDLVAAGYRRTLKFLAMRSFV